MPRKRPRQNQQYEKYWRLTVEYSDIFDLKFNNVLRIIVNYIDTNNLQSSGINREQYLELQNQIESIYSKADSASTRKSINQFLKLGFINNNCKGYHFLTKKFLDESDKEKKSSFFSRIIYDNSSFSRSVTKTADSNEYNFLLRTLEECVFLEKEELPGIMLVDVTTIAKGYLTKEEVNAQNEVAKRIDFYNRKYNQVNYIFNFCQYLAGISFGNNRISINPELVTNEEANKTRDPYLQRIYKEELYKESNIVGFKNKCFVESVAYPVLIASHIKPYRLCEKNEQFDVNNGLLLSKNIDSLFDLGYITFAKNGGIVFSKQLENDVVSHLSKLSLKDVYLNSTREQYMEYHRNNIFRG